MQTFLPYSSFTDSVACLDMKRLGKQRVEALQLINALTIPDYGWRNHPACVMWENHIEALALYHNICIEEWVSRGYNNTMVRYAIPDEAFITMPSWLGNEEFHASHRSNLLRKDPVWYGQFGWDEPNNLPYIWPTTQSNRRATCGIHI